MMQDISVRRLDTKETENALQLVWQVFMEFEAPDYTDEGIDEFNKSIHDNDFLSKLTIYGAFLNGDLCGVIATRNSGKHISLFFVDGKYHRQGIGKKLFLTVKTDNMTVNSSPYAVPVYQRLGFKKTDKEQSVNGLRFIPIKLS